eukprot:3937737-Amphidinium_carterae.2
MDKGYVQSQVGMIYRFLELCGKCLPKGNNQNSYHNMLVPTRMVVTSHAGLCRKIGFACNSNEFGSALLTTRSALGWLFVCVLGKAYVYENLRAAHNLVA